MEVDLDRHVSGDLSMTGDVFVDGVWCCHSLEDICREKVGCPVAEWKVPGKTAIPHGSYEVTLEDSPHFGSETLTLHDVPGFSKIRIHAGNTENDTEGCILVGEALDEHGHIKGGTSGPALTRLKALVKAALAREETVRINVTLPPEA